ncbi:MAG TPA: 2-dehydro-3-deoxygalactonokinase [Sphingomicrobium sp.]|nr:2-dehydro-3-deoxygalactonokinase [Sphingomicrobium sp.]
MTGRFIAVDWGTSRRRIFLIDQAAVVTSERDNRGAGGLSADDYGDEAAAIRSRIGDLPMLLAGMVGSNIGWRNVPYVEAPATLQELAGRLEWVDHRTAIVPGVRTRDGSRVDVMRGEEVQLLGAAVSAMVPAEAFLCQPGTHCKWAKLSSAAIITFTTAMTGELFALLSSQGLLARQLTGEVEVGVPFLEGVAEGAKRDLPAGLFSVRSRGLMGLLSDEDAASYASGMLIGADVAARIERGSEVHVLADPTLGRLYSAAIQALGGTARMIDSETAFIAGISAIWELAQ